MKKTLTICIVQILLCVACFAQTPNEKTDRYLATQMRDRQIPGLQLTVMKGDRVIFFTSKGLADVAFHIPVSDSTIFSVNSAAKIFAGVGLLQLAEADKVHLDDPVGRHLNNLPPSWQGITLRQLMGHVSGLPDVEDDRTDGLVGGHGEDSAWRLVQRLPLLAKPGETFNYNATNYLLIQKILEKYSLMPYEAWVRQEQFLVADIRQTFFANSDEVVDNKAPSYSYYFHDPVRGEYVKGDQLRQLHEDFPRMMRTDAGAFSTAQELATWIKALKSGRLLKQPESLRTLWTPVQLNNGKTEGFGGTSTGYALGWSVMERKVHPAVAAVGGGRAAIVVYPEDDLTVILLTNLSGCAPGEIADVIAGYYFDR
ncbi:serine hydrolase domain-containing protein [Chitinophaga alhagiae]|uniref:serine hydrolase domain-containing protein n=1 Tax=Chitinophaga alhagiae TaxID=2203219 RepID=UPI000E5B75E2|nr:serine hydrolase domain-containing protein [Chitinophaga alhagiae]